MTIGSVLEGSILLAKVEVMLGTNPAAPRPEASVYYGDGSFKGCSRGCVDAGPG